MRDFEYAPLPTQDNVQPNRQNKCCNEDVCLSIFVFIPSLMLSIIEVCIAIFYDFDNICRSFLSLEVWLTVDGGLSMICTGILFIGLLCFDDHQITDIKLLYYVHLPNLFVFAWQIVGIVILSSDCTTIDSIHMGYMIFSIVIGFIGTILKSIGAIRLECIRE